jgi:LPXTG-site transpeptidase (sortase) family protein
MADTGRPLEASEPVPVGEWPAPPGALAVAASPAPPAVVSGPARAVPGATSARSPASGPRRPALHAVGVGLILLAVVVLGFAGYLYGLSGVQEARAQTTLYERLQYELANQIAPLGPTTAGSPVAILNIPSVGLRDMVVVQGTSPENLALGPGHLRDTPLPGQAGVSQIFGRRATFGAPFALLPRLRPGDLIQVITGQGRSTYRVAAQGSSSLMVQDSSPNRLILLTASSPTVPAYYTYVDADLVSTANPGPTAALSISASEFALGNDVGALVLTLVWAMALAVVSFAGSIAASRWSPWPAYLAVAPVVLAVLWNLYQSLSALLPNVY